MPESFSIGALMGIAALQLAACGTGVSSEARSIQSSAQDLLQFTERSVALFGSKAALISQLNALLEESREPGWDTEEAQPLSELSAARAEMFIRALPPEIKLPEIAPEPDGAISFDWIMSKNRVFSVSIGTSERLPYAWLDGTDRGHAVAHFDGKTIPIRIVDGIRLITGNGDTLLRAA
jgi:hypothetical protein